MSNHVMIDLETLDTLPTAAFITVGACAFDPSTGKIGRTLCASIDWDSALHRRTISADTIKGWMKQGDAARMGAIKDGDSVEDALLGLRSRFGDCTVWGNGATFDISILENAYRQYDIIAPWKFYDVRDVRTVVDLAGGIVDKSSIPFEGTPHNALDDAIHQAKYVSAMWKALRNGR